MFFSASKENLFPIEKQFYIFQPVTAELLEERNFDLSQP